MSETNPHVLIPDVPYTYSRTKVYVKVLYHIYATEHDVHGGREPTIGLDGGYVWHRTGL